jgi:ABC-type sugar transport system ATPase subunit
MTTITLEHISKRFTQGNAADPNAVRVQALDNINLRIASGDVLAVVGPSGCGKSTLLRVIAGLDEPDEGHVLYDNVPLRDVHWRDRGVGMVFQDSALMPHWESGRSVGFFMWLRKREHEVPPRVARISEITGFGLDKLMSKRPAHLSGGEKQRVAIARALTRDPKIFLFDEPFSNLDAKLRTSARVELKRLLHEFPVTSVYVTHDQTEAMSLGHRIAVMRAGQIEQIGTYQHLYTNPRNLFVATFIGLHGINLFKGHVRGNQWHGENFGGFPLRPDLDEGTPVTMSARPEDIRLADSGVEAVVDEATPYFGEHFQLVQAKAGRETFSFTAPLQPSLRPGERVCCALSPDAPLYFDTKTGVRIG